MTKILKILLGSVENTVGKGKMLVTRIQSILQMKMLVTRISKHIADENINVTKISKILWEV